MVNVCVRVFSRRDDNGVEKIDPRLRFFRNDRKCEMKMFTSVPDLCSFLLSCCEQEVATVTNEKEPLVDLFVVIFFFLFKTRVL